MYQYRIRTKAFPIKGFTLIELIIAITILGVVLVLAVPNMTGVFQSNQATQESHDFVNAIQLAVSEADTSDAPVSLCAKKSTDNTCVTYATNPSTDVWGNGWLLFTDSSGSGSYTPGSDTLIKIKNNPSNAALLITAPATSITITPASVVTRGSGTFDFRPKTCSGNGGHRIVLTANAQVTASGLTCP